MSFLLLTCIFSIPVYSVCQWSGGLLVLWEIYWWVIVYLNLYLQIKIKINVLLTNGLKTPLMFKNALVLVYFIYLFFNFLKYLILQSRGIQLIQVYICTRGLCTCTYNCNVFMRLWVRCTFLTFYFTEEPDPTGTRDVRYYLIIMDIPNPFVATRHGKLEKEKNCENLMQNRGLAIVVSSVQAWQLFLLHITHLGIYGVHKLEYILSMCVNNNGCWILFKQFGMKCCLLIWFQMWLPSPSDMSIHINCRLDNLSDCPHQFCFLEH